MSTDVASFDSTSLAVELMSGNRRCLARSITLVESTLKYDREQANDLLDRLLTLQRQRSVRIGISGTPGVGKSTFIESLGLELIRRGLRVAVLAVDPSSVRTGGSILGDKTRMTLLSRAPEAFIRPTASKGILGGIADRTGEVVRLVEAAGYDIVLVETVGVGQSEVEVASVTDLFMLLVAPAGGDDLQGIKRGVMELVDAVVVNKADGDLASLANHTASDYLHALSFLRQPHEGIAVPVKTCSALHHKGVSQVWDTISDLWNQMDDRGIVEAKRADQAAASLERELRAILLQRFAAGGDDDARHQGIETDVRAHKLSPSSGAALLTETPPS